MAWMKTTEALKLVGERLQGWLETGIAHLPNALVALLVVAATWPLARAAARLLEQGLSRTALDGPLARLGATLARMLLLAGGLFLALSVMDLDKTVSSLLAGVGIVGLALGFAFRDIAANFMSGVLLAVRKPFEVGHLVEVDGHRGVVEGIDLRATTIRTLSGEHVVLPNRAVLEHAIVNYEKTPHRRVEIDVGVAYGDDLELAQRTLERCLAALDCRVADRDVQVIYTGFGGSSVDLSCRFWVEGSQGDFISARSAAIVAIKQALDREGLTIPFPIRTLDFGVVGGERLDEVFSWPETGKGRAMRSREPAMAT